MLYVVLFFLIFSLYLYVVLGGADYGAGIVELFSSEENQKITKKTIYRVMGPVWEANHIWIIILVVILWVGFPEFYNVLVVYLHIPLTLVLLGITMRGVAFVFRHYDAFKDKSQILKLLTISMNKLEFQTKEKKDTQRKVWRRLISKSFLTKREAFALMGFLKKIK